MFLSWFFGNEKFHGLIEGKNLAEEKDLNVFPETISTVVLGKDVQNLLDSFKHIFTEDAWDFVLDICKSF